MNIKSGHNRRLPAHDEKQIEELLIGEYRGAKIEEMEYSYPINDAQLMIEYTIRLFDHGDQTRFFRKVFKKGGKWVLSADFRTMKVEGSAVAEIEEMIKNYMES